MSTPRGPSLQAMNVARDMRRVFPGGKNGRTGLAPPKRTAQPTAVRAPSPGDGLHYYGQLRVTVGDLAGDFVDSETLILFEGTPTDDFQNGASGSWDLGTGKFLPGTGGYWGLWTDIVIGSVTSTDVGYLEGSASTTGNIRIPFYNTGSTLRAGVQIGPVPMFEGDFFKVIAHVDSTFSGVVAGGQAVMWPTGLFPEESA